MPSSPLTSSSTRCSRLRTFRRITPCPSLRPAYPALGTHLFGPIIRPKTDQATAVDLEHLQELARFIVECHSQAIAITNADSDAVIVVEIDTT
jgi:hypothetical protein